MALDLEAIDDELARRGIDPEEAARKAGISFIRASGTGRDPNSLDYRLSVAATNAPRVSFVRDTSMPAAPDLGTGVRQPSTEFLPAGAKVQNETLPVPTGTHAVPLSFANGAEGTVQSQPRRLSFAERFEQALGKAPLPAEYRMQPGEGPQGWKKWLDIAGQILTPRLEARIPGSRGNIEMRKAQQFADAKAASDRQMAAIGEEAKLEDTASQIAEREAEARKADAAAKAAPKVPEQEQELEDYLAANNLENTPANRDKARAALQARAKAAGQPDRVDKKIDEFIDPQGRRVNVMQRPDGSTYNAIRGPVKDGVAASPAGGTGEAVLGNLTPADAALVKGIANYEIDPKSLSYRGGAREKYLSLARQYDPTYDQTQYAARQAARKDFQSGKSAQNVRSLNTAIGHLNTLQDVAEELGNGGFQLWNRIANWGLTQAGDPRTVKFNDAANAVVNEMASVFKGTGATDQEIKEWRQQINSAQSPEQLRAGVQQLIQLMASRLEALDNQYRVGLGKPRDFRFLSPEARQILRRIGGSAAEAMLNEDNVAGAAQSNPAAPQPERDLGPAPAGRKEGDTGTLPDGTKVVVRNGRITAQ